MTKSQITNDQPDQSGFTLIETLVAMMVLSISLVIILQLFSGGLKASRLSDRYSRAIFYAREKMEEVLLSATDGLINGVSNGEFNDEFRWDAEFLYIAPDPEKEGEQPLPSPVDTFKVTVKVSWLDGEREKHFELSTLTIAKRILKEDEE